MSMSFEGERDKYVTMNATLMTSLATIYYCADRLVALCWDLWQIIHASSLFFINIIFFQLSQ